MQWNVHSKCENIWKKLEFKCIVSAGNQANLLKKFNKLHKPLNYCLIPQGQHVCQTHVTTSADELCHQTISNRIMRRWQAVFMGPSKDILNIFKIKGHYLDHFLSSLPVSKNSQKIQLN